MRFKMKETYNWVRCVLKIAAALAVVLLSFSLAGTLGDVTAYADDVKTSGYEGGIYWEFDANSGTLSIKAAGANNIQDTTDGSAKYTNGKMKDYTYFPSGNGSDAPGWAGIYDKVTSIVIADDVLNIGERAFGVASTKASSWNKKLDKVVIGTGVQSIGGLAFANVQVTDLRVYSREMTKDNISDTAFLYNTYEKDSSVAYADRIYRLDVTNVECFYGGVYDYFRQFTDGTVALSSSSVGFTSGSYAQATGTTVTPFNINVVDLNTLGTTGTVKITWDISGSTEQDAQIIKSGDTYDSTTLAIYKALYGPFTSSGYDVSKGTLKLFDLTPNDDSMESYGATVKISVPYDWRGHAASIKILSYQEDSNETSGYKITEINPSETVNDTDETITFVINHFSIYALYYDTTSDSSSGGGEGDGNGDASGEESPGVTDSADNKIVVDLSTDPNYIPVYSYQEGSGSENVNYVTSATSTASTAYAALKNASNAGDFKYLSNASNVKAFDLSATVNGVITHDAIAGLSVKVMIPSEWRSGSLMGSIKVIALSTDGTTIEVVSDNTTINTSNYLITFVPPHFSAYALYLDAEMVAGSDGTTAAGSQQTSTTASSNKTTQATTQSSTKTAAAATNANNNSGGNGSGSGSGSGSRDNTPGTGLKDMMWFAIPLAVLLLGVGVVVLGQRKHKVVEE